MPRPILTIFFALITVSLFAQTNQPPATDEEFNLFLMVFALVGLSIMAGFSVITIALAALVLFCVAAMMGAGVLSASVGVGIYKKSFTAAVRTAATLAMAVVCAIGGAVAGWLIDKLLNTSLSSAAMAMIGAGAGALGGIFGALGIFWLIKKLWGKLNLQRA